MAEPDINPSKSIKKPLLMPDTFSGNGSTVWTQYIIHFEACAELNEWDDSLKCKFLAILLKEQAANIFFDLDEETRNNWGVLKTALSARLDTSASPELAKSEFLARSRKPNESMIDFGNAIRQLGRKAYPKLPNEIRDELAKDQFLRGLGDREMTIRVRQSKPLNLDEAIGSALDYESICIDVTNSQKGEATREKSNVIAAATGTSGRLEEMMAEMLTLVKHNSLQSEAHAKESDRMQRRSTTYRGIRTCWECGSTRHIRTKCPRLTNDKTRVCWNCGSAGHLRDECPKSGNGSWLERRDRF